MADTRVAIGDKATVSSGIAKLVGTLSSGAVRLMNLAALKAFIGISGDIVGTSDTQELSGKTFTGCRNNSGLTIVSSDADFTLTYGTSTEVQRHTGTLTSNRTISLSGGATGAHYRVTRIGAGAFTLSVGGLKSLAQNTWCDVRYDGSAWVLAL
jgi:hypothetical protein